MIWKSAKLNSWPDPFLKKTGSAESSGFLVTYLNNKKNGMSQKFSRMTQKNLVSLIIHCNCDLVSYKEIDIKTLKSFFWKKRITVNKKRNTVIIKFWVWKTYSTTPSSFVSSLAIIKIRTAQSTSESKIKWRWYLSSISFSPSSAFSLKKRKINFYFLWTFLIVWINCFFKSKLFLVVTKVFSVINCYQIKNHSKSITILK